MNQPSKLQTYLRFVKDSRCAFSHCWSIVCIIFLDASPRLCCKVFNHDAFAAPALGRAKQHEKHVSKGRWKIIGLWPAIVFGNLAHFDTLQLWVLSSWASFGFAMASSKDQCQGCFDAATSLFIQCRTAHLELQRVALHEGRLLNRDSVQICSNDAELLNVAVLPSFFPKMFLAGFWFWITQVTQVAWTKDFMMSCNAFVATTIWMRS